MNYDLNTLHHGASWMPCRFNVVPFPGVHTLSQFTDDARHAQEIAEVMRKAGEKSVLIFDHVGSEFIDSDPVRFHPWDCKCERCI